MDDAMTSAAETPLQDLLRRIPRDAIYQWTTPEADRELWQLSSDSTPIGRLAHEAADRLDLVRIESARPATSAASEGEGVNNPLSGSFTTVESIGSEEPARRKATVHIQFEGPDASSKAHVALSYLDGLHAAALASPPVSERERELEGALDLCSAALQRLHTDIEALMADSEGVSGLHHNGDVATWEDLGQGGQFSDWLGEPLWAARNAWADARLALTAQPAGEGK